jgi:formylglycine-generating enzyme required for sulfatase activity
MFLASMFISALTNSVRAEDLAIKASKDAPAPLTAPFDDGQAKAAQEAWAKSLGKSSAVEKNSIGMELILIPPGSFRMGSPESEKGHIFNEVVAEVTLTKPFYLGKTEVTQGQWRAVMGTTPWKGERYVKEGENLAATFVGWEDAQSFCERAGKRDGTKYRLPTEAEWEYGCRSGTVTRYCFGDNESLLKEHGWYGGLYRDGNAANEQFANVVAARRPNAFGLHDMHGNVWEWSEDVYSEKRPGGTDPLVAGAGLYRVSRGGCWLSVAAVCRSADRYWSSPSERLCNLGFRIARSSVE